MKKLMFRLCHILGYYNLNVSQHVLLLHRISVAILDLFMCHVLSNNDGNCGPILCIGDFKVRRQPFRI